MSTDKELYYAGSKDVQEQHQPGDRGSHVDIETGDEPDMASIERVYRYATDSNTPLFPPSQGKKKKKNIVLTDYKKTGPPHNPSLLGPLLPVFSHPIQRRISTDHERRRASRPRVHPAFDSPSSLDGSGPVLRVLCGVRLAVESGHDETQSACVDESDCD